MDRRDAKAGMTANQYRQRQRLMRHIRRALEAVRRGEKSVLVSDRPEYQPPYSGCSRCPMMAKCSKRMKNPAAWVMCEIPDNLDLLTMLAAGHDLPAFEYDCE